MKSLVALLAIVLLATAGSTAYAEGQSISYSTWTLSPPRIVLKYVLPAAEAEHLTGSSLRLVVTRQLRTYLLQRLTVTANGQPCTALDQGWDLGTIDPVLAGQGLYGFEIFFRCASLTNLTLANHALFGIHPHHVDFATIETPTGDSHQLFTADHQTLRIPDADNVASAGLMQYVRLGIVHRTHGVDELCFLLGLFLLAPRKRMLAWVVAGLAVGGGVAVITSALGLLVPRPPLLHAFTGFFVAIAALEMFARGVDRRQVALWTTVCLLALAAVAWFKGATPAALTLAGAALLGGSFLASASGLPVNSRHRVPLLALLFGFLDGFVLPADLVPANLTSHALAYMNIGFNLGTLLVDIVFLVVLAILTAFAWPRWRRWRPSTALVHDLSATALGGLGTFWLISRLVG